MSHTMNHQELLIRILSQLDPNSFSGLYFALKIYNIVLREFSLQCKVTNQNEIFIEKINKCVILMTHQNVSMQTSHQSDPNSFSDLYFAYL